jgi:hypothetical protein
MWNCHDIAFSRALSINLGNCSALDLANDWKALVLAPAFVAPACPQA